MTDGVKLYQLKQNSNVRKGCKDANIWNKCGGSYEICPYKFPITNQIQGSASGGYEQI